MLKLTEDTVVISKGAMIINHDQPLYFGVLAHSTCLELCHIIYPHVISHYSSHKLPMKSAKKKRFVSGIVVHVTEKNKSNSLDLFKCRKLPGPSSFVTWHPGKLLVHTTHKA